LVQIGKGISLLNQIGVNGSVIDLDSFTTEHSGEFTTSLSSFLDSAHQAEKELFFKILKPEFISTLSPVYEDEK
jgi:uncharacterized protein (TIGR04255 family)